MDQFESVAFADNEYHYRVLAVRCKRSGPIRISFSCPAEVLEVKGHETDPPIEVEYMGRKYEHNSTVDLVRSKALWSSIESDLEVGRTSRSGSSTSSFSVINEGRSDIGAWEWDEDQRSHHSQRPVSQNSDNDNFYSWDDTSSKKEQEPGPEPGPEQKADPEPEPQPQPQLQLQPEPEPEPEPEHEQDNRSEFSDLGYVNIGVVGRTDHFDLRDDPESRNREFHHSDARHPLLYEALICHGIEFSFALIELLKEPGKSRVTPLALTLEYLERILNCEAFLQLKSDQLGNILTLERNDSAIEAALAKSVVKWAEESRERELELPSFLQTIKLQSLNIQQLIDLSNMRLIRTSLQCRDIIDVTKNNLLMSMSTSLQTMENVNNMYILARGYTRTFEYSIHQVNLNSGITRKITCKPAVLLAKLGESLFLFGHRNPSTRSVDVYNLEKKAWNSKTSWPVDLVISSMVTYDQWIYFIASIGASHNFYKYDPSSDEFRMILTPSRLMIRENEKIGIYNEQILFISNGVAYDPVLFKWSFLVALPLSFLSHPLTIFKDRLIYLVEPDRFFWFDPRTGKRGLHSPLSCGSDTKPGKVIDLIVIKSKLYLVEKCSFGVRILNYEEEANSWMELVKVDIQNEPMRCAITTDDL